MPCVFVWERTKINLLIFGSWMCALWIRWNNEIDTSLVVMDKRHFNPLYHLVLVHIHLYVLTYKNTHLFRMRNTNLIASMFLIKIIVGAKIYKKNALFIQSKFEIFDVINMKIKWNICFAVLKSDGSVHYSL